MRTSICLCLAWLSVLQVGFVREVASTADAPQQETLLPEKFKEPAEQSVKEDVAATVERVPRQSIQNTNILIDNQRGRGGGGGCRHGGCHHGGGCRHGGCGGHHHGGDCRHRDCRPGGGFGFGFGGGIFGGK